MSKERYFELYKQFLNQTISREDYHDLMDWVSDVENDVTLRRYMNTIWAEDDWGKDANPKNWNEFKNQILHHRPKKSIKRIFLMSRIWYYAASLLILLAAVYGLYQYQQPNTITYHTAYGQTKNINLNDGSIVTLNANSTLVWDHGWENTGHRHVKLSGEAFFEVKHTLDNQDFVVETDDLNVKVLGTSFNVQSRHDLTDVTLETGKIELDLNRSENKSFEMEPGDRIQFSIVGNTLKKDKVKTIAESANWLDGVLRFEDVTVEDMFREIEDLYGKKLMKADSSLLNRRMFTGIPYKDWNVAKEAIELALGVKIEENRNELYIKE